MLPASYDDDVEVDIPLPPSENNEEGEIYPSHTYAVDFDTGQMVGMCDSLEAVRQAVYKMLRTDLYAYVIYTNDYGSELYELDGQPKSLAAVMSEEYVTSCLTQDDRITDVTDFVVTQNEIDSLVVSFTVVTIEGDFTESIVVQ